VPKRPYMLPFFSLAACDDGLVGNAIDKGPRFDELAQVANLERTRTVECFGPIAIGMVDFFLPFAPELPDAVVAVGYSTGPRKDGTVGLFAHIIVVEVPVVGIPGGPRVHRMVLIVGLRIQGGFGWHQRPVAR